MMLMLLMLQPRVHPIRCYSTTKKIADFLRRKNSANTNCCCHVVALLHLNPLFLCVFFPLRRFLHSIPIFGGERLGDGLVYRQ